MSKCNDSSANITFLPTSINIIKTPIAKKKTERSSRCLVNIIVFRVFFFQPRIGMDPKERRNIKAVSYTFPACTDQSYMAVLYRGNIDIPNDGTVFYTRNKASRGECLLNITSVYVTMLHFFLCFIKN